MIDRNFFTYKILENKKKNVLIKFPELATCKHDNFYSLSEYIYDSPSKFYDREIFLNTKIFLENLIRNKNETISFFKILNNFSFEFDHAVKTLNTINNKNIHEVLLPDNEELMFFLSEKVIYEYLKLNDVVLLGILKPIAYYVRIKNNKGTDKLDIYNCIETLKGISDFNSLTSRYNNTVRNAIAHGGVTFETSKITFKDKKESKEYYSKTYIKEFDDLVDSVNAIVLAYKKVLFQNFDLLSSYNISIPYSIMEIELRYKTNHYGWEILHSYDSTIQKGSQYNLLIKTSLNSGKFMNFSAAYVAITLERLIPYKYNSVFFHIKTKYSMPCWQSVDLEKLREHYEGKSVIITQGTMFFDEKFLAEKKDRLRIFKSIFKSSFPTQKKFMNVRYIKHHNKSNYNVIENAGIYLDAEDVDTEEIMDFIRTNTKKIISLVKSQKRKNYSSGFKDHFFKDKYLQINIYNRDFRKRTFYSNNKNDNFIAMLHINNSKQIKDILPVFGIQEKNNNCLIIWNKNLKV